ncbi:vanadium-dependent haloperoxidase [Portibacter marinus]|uniref:vanadium-dependent haloperoxidase n=1 Tax=Portibacter marinus TaxID=2898660 RepID=UPI001F1A9FD6|nr:vanadium-dependent haloperoxidase [Portibacter marinus]
MRYLLNIILVTLIFASCQQEVKDYDHLINDAEIVHDYMDKLSDVIVHDIFSPPVASRNYVYPSIAGYEAILHSSKDLESFVGRLNGFENVAQPDTSLEISFPLASIQAFHVVSKALIFSEDTLAQFHHTFLEDLKQKGFPEKVLMASQDFGNAVATSILEWANEDNYKETRSYPKYTVDYEPHTWKPTPPAYMSSIEPHWNKIRPMVLDSATQFVPDPPTEFNLDKDSRFYKEMMEVYTAVKDADEEQTEIANFWDCNPYKMNQTGHVMFATKKITPGGHWIGIAKIASQKANLSMEKTMEVYALCSIALFDGFISCWDEKYRSKLIRPETVINEHVDEDWLPILQTPPFPEHTSGHSVISRAAAVVLTEIFGENFSFDDDTELQYGLPIRSFASFKEASEEAAISRLYGGIHYRPAIDYGVAQGENVGEFIIEELNI